jgi:hypothetical protein
VPVPPLEAFVRARTEHYDTDYLSSDPAFVHAHVTALGPFLPPEAIGDDELATLRGVLLETAPFDIELARIDTFPNGIIHLVPEPEEPLRRLTARLAEAFPQCPPYAGEFPGVRPHLTLDARSDTVSEASTLALLGDLVPASWRAERVDLAWYAPGDCRVLATWALGPGATPPSAAGSAGPPGAEALRCQRSEDVTPSTCRTTSATSS